MKKIVIAFILSIFMLPAFAQKSCEELKAEIAAKLDAKGIENYTLEIVPNEEVQDQEVVGSCEGGTKKITYERD